MLFPKAKKIAKQNNWFATDKLVFGLYKDYLFQISDANPFSGISAKYIHADISSISEEQLHLLSLQLNENKKALKFSAYAIQNNTILFTFNENLTLTKMQTIYNLLDFLVDIYTRLNLPKANYCQNCGTTDNVKFYNLNGKGIQLCSLCTSDFKRHIYRNESDERRLNSTYTKGIMGALLFAVPGIVIWVISAYYLNTMSSGMALLIGILGFLGYTKFQGKKGKKGLFVLSITNIFSVFLANLIVFVAQLTSIDGYTVRESFQLLFNKEVFIEYTRLPLFLSTIFCIVTTLAVSELIKKGPYIVPAVKIKP